MIASQKLVEAGFADDVGLLYVVSEETDHSGMKKANELGLSPKHMVVGEPTDMKMIRLQKGILKIRLSRQGAAAHSGACLLSFGRTHRGCFQTINLSRGAECSWQLVNRLPSPWRLCD